jgi:hypothetical protein
MATIQQEILDSFYEELATSDTVDAAMIDSLRELFHSGRKLRADDVVAVLVKEKEGSEL